MKKLLCLTTGLIFLAGCMTATRIVVDELTKPSPEQIRMNQHILSGRTNTQILLRSGLITRVDVRLREARVDAALWNQKTDKEKMNIFYSWLLYLVYELGHIRMIETATMRESDSGKLVAIYENKSFRLVE